MRQAITHKNVYMALSHITLLHAALFFHPLTKHKLADFCYKFLRTITVYYINIYLDFRQLPIFNVNIHK